MASDYVKSKVILKYHHALFLFTNLRQLIGTESQHAFCNFFQGGIP